MRGMRLCGGLRSINGCRWEFRKEVRYSELRHSRHIRGNAMLGKWVRHLLWKPFEAACRRSPLIPLQASITKCNDLVIQIRIDNVVTRAISRLGGGYDYSVSYIVDDSLLIDTGFPWVRRSLRRTLIELGVDKT